MSVVAGDIVIELSMDDKTFKASVKNTGPILAELTRNINKSAESLKKMEQQQLGVGRQFRDLVLTMGNLRFVMMDLNDIFLKLPMSIQKTAGELEKTKVLMKGLSKSLTDSGKEAEAAADFKYVTQMAKSAPFALSALTDSFVKLKTAGIAPASGALQAMVDSVAKFGGNGESLKRATVAIQQMAGKGVVSMEELRQQLGEAIPDAMKAMADGMGMTMAELAKAVSKGTVGAGTAIDKMLLQMQVNNSGAAAEMMKTWVGMTARLKSEWELLALDISNAGLGDAAKKVVADLTEAMHSDEIRRFGNDMGVAFGGAIESIASIVKTLVQYRSEIKLAAEAWLVYKAYSSFIVPWSKDLNKGFSDARTSVRAYSAAQGIEMSNAATSARASAIAQQMALRETALSAEAAAGQMRGVKQQELAQVARVNLLIQAEQAAHEARMDAIRAAGNVDTGAGRRLAATMAENAAQLAVTSASMTKLKTEIKGYEAAMYAAGNTVVGHNAKVKELEGSTMALTRAKTGLANVMQTTLSGAFNIMGGYIGIAITAVMALAWAWEEFGNQAEKNAARAKRAAAGVANADDLRDAKKELASKKKELADAQKEGENAYTLDANGAAQLLGKDASKARIDMLEKQVKQASETLVAVERNVLEDEARSRATSMQSALRRTELAQKDFTDEKIRQLDAARDKELGALDKGSKDYDKKYKEINNRYVTSRTEEFIKGKEKQAASLKAAEDEYAARASDSSLSKVDQEAARLELRRVTEQRAQIDNELNAAKKAFTEKNDILNPKGDPKAKKEKLHTPLENLLIALQGDRAELEAELITFQNSMAKADKAFAAGEKVRALADAGKYDYKDKNGKKVTVKRGDVEQAAMETEGIARQKEGLRLATEFTTGAKAIEADYKRAAAMLADPLGIKSDGGKAAEFDLKMSLITPQELASMAAAMNVTVDQLNAKIGERRRMLATEDLVGPYREMVESTRTLGFELILDDRQRVRAQMTSDNELFRQRMQNRIEEKRQAGVSNADILKMQEELNKNMAARGLVLVERTKSPMERMADDWGQATKSMEEASVQWANGSLDALVNFATTGKFAFGDFTKSVLADILKIEAKKSLSGGISNMLSGVTSSIAGLFGFADGGIMSAGGSMPLKKYAKGGIASSPQMAIYGEGSMNEAYVPLPDGRSIPVTMDGGSQGAGNVTVNVINQSGTPVGATQGSPRFDGQQMVLEVVLTAVNTPGAFRDSMKQAVRG